MFRQVCVSSVLCVCVSVCACVCALFMHIGCDSFPCVYACIRVCVCVCGRLCGVRSNNRARSTYHCAIARVLLFMARERASHATSHKHGTRTHARTHTHTHARAWTQTHARLNARTLTRAPLKHTNRDVRERQVLQHGHQVRPRDSDGPQPGNAGVGRAQGERKETRHGEMYVRALL